MGKNNTRESLTREIASVVLHHIVREHTNRPESVHFLESETIEYRNKAEKMSQIYNWNSEDRVYVEKKALKLIIEKLANKYPDIKYKEQEAVDKISKIIKDIM